MLTWYVFYEDFNARKIIITNIFKHSSFIEDIKKAINKYNKTLNEKEFWEKIDSSLRYYYWSKAEAETVVISLIHPEKCEDMKIDIYDQIKMNWDAFREYLWNHKNEIK